MSLFGKKEPGFFCGKCDTRLGAPHCQSKTCTWLTCDTCGAFNEPLAETWIRKIAEDQWERSST